jgi:hypothetical protein
MEEHRQRVFENKLLRRIYRLKSDQVKDEMGRACSMHREEEEEEECI